MKKNTIGLDVNQPKEDCKDPICPFHGTLKVRGRMMRGVVIKKDAHKTVTVEFPRTYFLAKYERFAKRRTRIRCHNPRCINAQINDPVTIVECRKLSKTKSFVVVEVPSA
ncbi:30S ribosomal protein S17 [archaeon]|nr:30S ribosomal protein S17 [archaeon]